jgi:N-methylhydantoinase A
VLSALGLVVSERRSDAVESVLLSGADLTDDAIEAAVDRLAERARSALGTSDGEVRETFDLRYAGQAFELSVTKPQKRVRPLLEGLRREFDAAHRERYGYDDPDAEVELVTVRVAVVLPGGEAGHGRDAPAGEVTGPGTVDLGEATLVVPDGWTGRADESGTWIVERSG